MSVSASKYERVANEKYYTPAWVTQALFSVERFSRVFDPAGGDGAIINAVPAGMAARAIDIAPDSPRVDKGDFFDVLYNDSWDIITNPPYGVQSRLAVRFIEHALALTAPAGGKVAMLLKVGFDSADGRRHLFDEHPAFAAEYRLTKRIRWTNLPQSDAGPTENHSWFVWSWAKSPNAPAIKAYLPLKELAHA